MVEPEIEIIEQIDTESEIDSGKPSITVIGAAMKNLSRFRQAMELYLPLKATSNEPVNNHEFIEKLVYKGQINSAIKRLHSIYEKYKESSVDIPQEEITALFENSDTIAIPTLLAATRAITKNIYGEYLANGTQGNPGDQAGQLSQIGLEKLFNGLNFALAGIVNENTALFVNEYRERKKQQAEDRKQQRIKTPTVEKSPLTPEILATKIAFKNINPPQDYCRRDDIIELQYLSENPQALEEIYNILVAENVSNITISPRTWATPTAEKISRKHLIPIEITAENKNLNQKKSILRKINKVLRNQGIIENLNPVFNIDRHQIKLIEKCNISVIADSQNNDSPLNFLLQDDDFRNQIEYITRSEYGVDKLTLTEKPTQTNQDIYNISLNGSKSIGLSQKLKQLFEQNGYKAYFQLKTFDSGLAPKKAETPIDTLELNPEAKQQLYDIFANLKIKNIRLTQAINNTTSRSEWDIQIHGDSNHKINGSALGGKVTTIFRHLGFRISTDCKNIIQGESKPPPIIIEPVKKPASPLAFIANDKILAEHFKSFLQDYNLSLKNIGESPNPDESWNIEIDAYKLPSGFALNRIKLFIEKQCGFSVGEIRLKTKEIRTQIGKTASIGVEEQSAGANNKTDISKA